MQGLIVRARTDERRAELEAELAVPPFPQALSYLWQAFSRVRNRKGGSMGIEPITWPDLDAFIRMSGTRFAPWEIEVIEALDDAFLSSRAPTETDE